MKNEPQHNIMGIEWRIYRIASQVINIFKNRKNYLHGPINMEANPLFNRGVGEVIHPKIWKLSPRP